MSAALTIDESELLQVIGSMRVEVYFSEGYCWLHAWHQDATVDYDETLRRLVDSGHLAYLNLVYASMPPKQPLVITDKGRAYLAEGEKV